MVTERNYITVEISNAMTTRARERLGGVHIDRSLPLNKFASEELRTFYGYLGEEMIASLLKLNLVDRYDYDAEGRIEIKSISCQSRPKAIWDVTVLSWKDSDKSTRSPGLHL